MEHTQQHPLPKLCCPLMPGAFVVACVIKAPHPYWDAQNIWPERCQTQPDSPGRPDAHLGYQSRWLMAAGSGPRLRGPTTAPPASCSSSPSEQLIRPCLKSMSVQIWFPDPALKKRMRSQAWWHVSVTPAPCKYHLQLYSKFKISLGHMRLQSKNKTSL